MKLIALTLLFSIHISAQSPCDDIYCTDNYEDTYRDNYNDNREVDTDSEIPERECENPETGMGCETQVLVPENSEFEYENSELEYENSELEYENSKMDQQYENSELEKEYDDQELGYENSELER